MTYRFDRFTVRASIIQRLVLVGPFEQIQPTLDELNANNFRTVRSGPYTDAKIHPNADMTRFLIIADRLLGSNPNQERRSTNAT